MFYAKIWTHGIDVIVALYDSETDEFVSSDCIGGIQAEGTIDGKPLETDPLKIALDTARFWGCKRIDIDLT